MHERSLKAIEVRAQGYGFRSKGIDNESSHIRKIFFLYYAQLVAFAISD
jgi:hypothetical protein